MFEKYDEKPKIEKNVWEVERVASSIKDLIMILISKSASLSVDPCHLK